MRETVASLKQYFTLVGVLSALFDLMALVMAFDRLTLGLSSYLHTAVCALSLAIGFAYIYLGQTLPTLLESRPFLPRRLAAAATVLAGLRWNPIGVLINLYIYFQLKRLATEANPITETRVLS